MLSKAKPSHCVYSDASGTWSCGTWCNNSWLEGVMVSSSQCNRGASAGDGSRNPLCFERGPVYVLGVIGS